MPAQAKQSVAAQRTFIDGEKFFILEDYSKALVYFQQSLEHNADNAAAYYKLAEIYLKGNKEQDLVKAAQNIENALRLENKNKYYYLLASQIYISLRQPDKAAKAIETLLKEVTGTEDNFFDLAAIYLQQNQLDNALKAYDRAEAALGINEISSLQKQQIYATQGKWKNAIEEGEKLIQAYPDEERYTLIQAEYYSQQKNYLQAEALLEKFIATHAEAGNSKVMLASLYRKAGQEKKSNEYVNTLMGDPSVDVRSKVLMVSTYNGMLAQNKTKKIKDQDLEKFAIELFAKLKNANPTDMEVCLIGGDLFLTLDKNQEAINEYAQAVRLNANRIDAWQNLFFLEAQGNMTDSLLTHSEKALEVFPNEMMVYYFNGMAHLQKKNYKEAIQILEQAKKLGNDNTILSEVSGMLGDAYNATQDHEKSDKAYEDALAVNPNNDYVLNNYSYFLALRKVNLEKAEKMSALSLKNQPENTAFIDTYAWILFQQGNYKEAKKTMEKLFLLEKGNAENLEHYGDILYQLGDVDAAVAQWQNAKSQNKKSESLDKKIMNRKIN